MAETRSSKIRKKIFHDVESLTPDGTKIFRIEICSSLLPDCLSFRNTESKLALSQPCTAFHKLLCLLRCTPLYSWLKKDSERKLSFPKTHQNGSPRSPTPDLQSILYNCVSLPVIRPSVIRAFSFKYFPANPAVCPPRLNPTI